jgi:hypothetical protein
LRRCCTCRFARIRESKHRLLREDGRGSEERSRREGKRALGALLGDASHRRLCAFVEQVFPSRLEKRNGRPDRPGRPSTGHRGANRVESPLRILLLVSVGAHPRSIARRRRLRRRTAVAAQKRQARPEPLARNVAGQRKAGAAAPTTNAPPTLRPRVRCRLCGSDRLRNARRLSREAQRLARVAAVE